MRLIILFLFIASGSVLAKGSGEDCIHCDAKTPKGLVENLVDDLNAITKDMYKKVVDIKVNYDGSGSLSVYYDQQGKPRLLRLQYTSKKGKVTDKVLTFDQIAKGESLIYENSDVPGKAIVVEKQEPFNNGNQYQFSFKVRKSLTGKDSEDYLSHALTFNADKDRHSVTAQNNKFTSIVISPGIRMLSWDGTFKGVEFK